jgi:hypothetical protein
MKWAMFPVKAYLHHPFSDFRSEKIMEIKDPKETMAPLTVSHSRRIKGAPGARGIAVPANAAGLLASCQKEENRESKAPAIGTAKGEATEWNNLPPWAMRIPSTGTGRFRKRGFDPSFFPGKDCQKLHGSIDAGNFMS